MLALFAGTGALPGEIVAALTRAGWPFVVCEMQGFAVEGVEPAHKTGYRLEHLGSLLNDLRGRGVREVCFAGAIHRPRIDPAEIDAATRPFVPLLQDAMAQGDDGALRGIIALFEGQGFAVVAAHDLVPHLLPSPGVLTGPEPDESLKANVQAAITRHSEMSRQDTGQAVISGGGRVLASEGPEGTDAMILAFEGRGAEAVLYKAPKLGQDRRADLPVIGPGTVENAARRGITSIVIEAGGVMVLDLPEVTRLARQHGLRLWVREAGQ